MITTMIALLSVVGPGKVDIQDVFPYQMENKSINSALYDCNKERKTGQYCMLAQQRDKNTLVFTDLQTNMQIVVKK